MKEAIGIFVTVCNLAAMLYAAWLHDWKLGLAAFGLASFNYIAGFITGKESKAK